MSEQPDPVEQNGDPQALRVACLVVWLQTVALVGLAVWVLIDTVESGASHAARGALGAAFAAIAAATLAAGARGLQRRSTAARTPIVVLELLALPVSYTMAFAAHRPELGGPILITALVVLYCLFTPPVRLIFDRAPRD